MFGSKRLLSEKNGPLDIQRWPLSRSVSAGGIFQSGPLVQKVFRKMFRLLPRDFTVKKILLLGLGAGCCLPEIVRRFGKVHVVAIEYDEVMIELAKQWHVKSLGQDRLEILRGDLLEVLPTLTGEFDLVLIDVFCGSKVAPVLMNPAVLSGLRRLLAWQGAILANFFREIETYGPVFEKFFTCHAVARKICNHVALYRHLGMGKMGEPTPEDFKDREQIPGYLRMITNGEKWQTVREKEGVFFVEHAVGPLRFERWVCPEPPDLAPCEKIRMVSWQAYEGERQPGWFRVPKLFDLHFLKGMARVEEGYWESWSHHARRHRERFLRESWKAESVDLETFAEAYHASRALDPITRRTFVHVLKYYQRFLPENLHLRVVRGADGHVVAGLATADFTPASLSTHLIAFVRSQGLPSCAGVGLIEDWLGRCLKEGMVWAHFGILARPQDPKSWRGYTDFKRQFHLREILKPRLALRVIFPKNRVTPRVL